MLRAYCAMGFLLIIAKFPVRICSVFTAVWRHQLSSVVVSLAINTETFCFDVRKALLSLIYLLTGRYKCVNQKQTFKLI